MNRLKVLMYLIILLIPSCKRAKQVNAVLEIKDDVQKEIVGIYMRKSNPLDTFSYRANLLNYSKFWRDGEKWIDAWKNVYYDIIFENTDTSDFEIVTDNGLFIPSRMFVYVFKCDKLLNKRCPAESTWSNSYNEYYNNFVYDTIKAGTSKIYPAVYRVLIKSAKFDLVLPHDTIKFVKEIKNLQTKRIHEVSIKTLWAVDSLIYQEQLPTIINN